jgi:hypothetical protein
VVDASGASKDNGQYIWMREGYSCGAGFGPAYVPLPGGFEVEADMRIYEYAA